LRCRLGEAAGQLEWLPGRCRRALDEEGESMKPFVIAAVAAAGMMMTGMANADEALAKKSGCLTCHAVDKKKMGPAFKDVAANYRGKADAQAAIVAKLKAGKDHPAVKANEADLASLTKWVLSR
jgi:cytochrome c